MKIPDVNLDRGILRLTHPGTGAPQVVIDLRQVWAITTKGPCWTFTGSGPVTITIDDFGEKPDAVKEAVVNVWAELRSK